MRLTVAMDDARWLRQSLHAEHGPEIDRRVGVPPLRGISTEHQEVVAEDPDERARGLLRRETLDLHRRRVALRVDHLERDRRLAHHPREQEGPIHDEAPAETPQHRTRDALQRHSPVGLDQRTGELATDPRLPLHELPARL